jgi:biopolymer transport protein ExbD
MRLKRLRFSGIRVSVVPMIDVLMILLIFFMVTSTYLNVGMIPVAEKPMDGSPVPGATAPSATLLVRLSADGRVLLQGRPVDLSVLGSEVLARKATQPDLIVTVLPSGYARTQALVSVMDALATAGITRLRIVNLEGGS